MPAYGTCPTIAPRRHPCVIGLAWQSKGPSVSDGTKSNHLFHDFSSFLLCRTSSAWHGIINVPPMTRRIEKLLFEIRNPFSFEKTLEPATSMTRQTGRANATKSAHPVFDLGCFFRHHCYRSPIGIGRRLAAAPVPHHPGIRVTYRAVVEGRACTHESCVCPGC